MIAVGILFALVLAVIAVIDARTYRIPNVLSLPLILCGIGWNSYAAENAAPYVIGAAAGYLLFAGFGALYYQIRGRDGLGLGDAKLFAAGGAWLGWEPLPLVLLIASTSALLYALATHWILGRDLTARLAWGPWLCASIWLIWIARFVTGVP